MSRALTTALKSLCEAHVRVICLDNYFDDPLSMAKTSTGCAYPDYEHPKSIRWLDFARDVDESVVALSGQDEAYVIIEGFLLFHHKSVMERCDLAFFIELRKELAKERRMSTKPVPEDYFEDLLWPRYLQYGQARPGAVLLDGQHPEDVLASHALAGLYARFGIAMQGGEEHAGTDLSLSTATPGRSVPLPGSWLRSVGSGRPVVLILSGSFNPVHRMHIECLVLSRRYLMKEHGLNVNLAFLAPSSDGYIASKVCPHPNPNHNTLTTAGALAADSVLTPNSNYSPNSASSSRCGRLAKTRNMHFCWQSGAGGCAISPSPSPNLDLTLTTSISTNPNHIYLHLNHQP